MAKKFTYVDAKTGKTLYESVEANYVSTETVDKKVVASLGQDMDPRLNPFVQRVIRVVEDK